MKKSFFDCRSVAEMGVSFTMFAVFMLFLAFIVTAVLSAAIECIPACKNIMRPIVIVISSVCLLTWLSLLLLLTKRFIRTGKQWEEERLSTREFFYFQVGSAGLYLLLLMLLPLESRNIARQMDYVFYFLSLMMNASYLFFAWKIYRHAQPLTYLGLLANVTASILGRVLGNY